MIKLFAVSLPLLFLIFNFSNVYSQEIISSTDAKDHVGEFQTVSGLIVDVFKSKNGNIFVNFDKKFPGNTFTAVIFKTEAEQIEKWIPEGYYSLIGKVISVTGLIETYNEKPQIVLKNKEQLKF